MEKGEMPDIIRDGSTHTRLTRLTTLRNKKHKTILHKIQWKTSIILQKTFVSTKLSPRSPPQEQSCQWQTFLIKPDMDPTPKRYLVNGRQIVIDPYGSHPEENLGSEMEGRQKSNSALSKKELTVTLRSRPQRNSPTTTTLTVRWPVELGGG